MKQSIFTRTFLGLAAIVMLAISACAPPVAAHASQKVEAMVEPASAALPQEATVEFTLKTAMAEGKMVFVGVGGDIDGLVNPDLVVEPGAVVKVNLVNGDGPEHDIVFTAWRVWKDG